MSDQRTQAVYSDGFTSIMQGPSEPPFPVAKLLCIGFALLSMLTNLETTTEGAVFQQPKRRIALAPKTLGLKIGLLQSLKWLLSERLPGSLSLEHPLKTFTPSCQKLGTTSIHGKLSQVVSQRCEAPGQAARTATEVASKIPYKQIQKRYKKIKSLQVDCVCVSRDLIPRRWRFCCQCSRLIACCRT